MTTATTYQAAGRHLLAQARSELERGDARQASEKGWGAAAQMLKAISERRGWMHKSHAAFFAVIDRLANETHDDDLRRRFHAANSLHTNFYENLMDVSTVRVGLDDVERLMDLLEALD